MGNVDIKTRLATREDILQIVNLLADDELGSKRESFTDPLANGYIQAFKKIQSSPDNELIVMEHNGEVIGCMQLTFIPYLTFQGGSRCQIEGVRISSKHRGCGIGGKMFLYAIEKSKGRGCHMIQLTTNKDRVNTHKFYEKLGFKATHEGFKLYLNNKVETGK
ncbi:MAG: GNAT family N-acetyltransferase [Francisellaceae bacterium]|jgi:N-acetylglutamate synthase-like GNAT family acetyltransferase|nr:GNAT family N-acetyltransferase [Francisellaceae bacterium]MBT6207735.1 GNAT family N-acetyltransferase [Francisellaceae bacterium]MBT6539871.1 GNAT family N-acetyltransferase [Francisellaceae bacterium]